MEQNQLALINSINTYKKRLINAEIDSLYISQFTNPYLFSVNNQIGNEQYHHYPITIF
jgi:hypothetical protein